MDKILPYAKFVVSIIGAGVVSALTFAGPDTDLFKWLTVASAVITAILVYQIPNQVDGKHEAPPVV